MSYNALDNIENAKKLLEQIKLESQDLTSSLSYDHATSWCDDCPTREPREPQSYSEMYFPRPPAPSCCKYDGSWDEDHQSDYDHEQKLRDVIKALAAYVGEAVK